MRSLQLLATNQNRPLYIPCPLKPKRFEQQDPTQENNSEVVIGATVSKGVVYMSKLTWARVSYHDDTGERFRTGTGFSLRHRNRSEIAPA